MRLLSLRTIVHMKYGALLVLSIVLVLAASGCKSLSSMSAKAIDCRTSKLEILDSRFSREGTTTSWCARCDGQTHICVTNPNRDRVECRQVDAGPPCE